jgi:hypothetical protein
MKQVPFCTTLKAVMSLALDLGRSLMDLRPNGTLRCTLRPNGILPCTLRPNSSLRCTLRPNGVTAACALF